MQLCKTILALSDPRLQPKNSGEDDLKTVSKVFISESFVSG